MLVKGYKFGLMTLEFKKFSDPNEDAYFKDFLDILDTDSKVGNDLSIIKVAFVRDSSKCSIAKIQSSGYKAHHFLGIAPQESENDNEYRKNGLTRSLISRTMKLSGSTLTISSLEET